MSPRTVAVVALLAGAPAGLAAQAVDTTLVTSEYNRLKTPESPAFHILGIAPSAIARPTSPRAFAFSFLGSLREQETFSLIPSDFAIEVNPYWWAAHPDLSFRDYQAGGLRSLYRTLTFSLATTDSTLRGPDGDRSFRRLGLGLRTTVFGPQRDPACIARIESAVRPLSEAVAERIAVEIARDPGLAGDAGRLEQLRERAFAEALESLPPEARAALSARGRQACTDEIADRRGFVMAIAGAAGFGFLDREVPGAPVPVPAGGLGTLGLWITPSWLGERFGAIGVARVAWTGIDSDSTGTSWDIGLRSVYAYGRYAGSLEALARRNSTGADRSRFRIAAVFDAKVTEDLWLTATFGRDFEERDGSGLIALANLQWNLGKPGARPIPLPGR